MLRVKEKVLLLEPFLREKEMVRLQLIKNYIKTCIGLIDLNHTETEEIENSEFLGFEKINYPSVLKDSFIISLPKLVKDEKAGLISSLYNMIGTYPAKHYRSFFSLKKNKLHKVPLKHQVHDILKCKMPNLAVIDASEKGYLIIGQPLEMDKQAANALGLDWKNIPYLKLVHESLEEKPSDKENVEQLIGS